MASVTFKRGVYSTISGLTGTFLYQSIDKNQSASEDTVSDQNGNIAGAVLYDRVTTRKISAEFATGATMPAIGDSLTLDGVSYTVISVNEAQSNKGAAKVDIDCKRYEENAFAPSLLTTTTTTTTAA